MLKNYLKIAFRNIRKQKLYSLINIFGLTFGITCCILIYLFIQDEYSFDRFHKNADQIYRIDVISYEKPQSQIEPTPFFDARFPDGMTKYPWLPLPMGPTIAEQVPGLESFTRFDQSTAVVRSGTDSFEEEILFTDSTFFELFTFPMIKGDASSVLKDLNSVVLTSKSAQKYFGNQNPIGKSLTITVGDEEEIFTVTGIAQTPPANSSISFSIVMRIERTPYHDFNKDRWFSFNTPLFVKLNEKSRTEAFTANINKLAEERYAESWAESRTRLGIPDEDPVEQFVLSPLTSIHLDAASQWDKVSNPLYSYILGAIAILILIIACINYVTLALARSSGRAKEVGIRKASGAQRSQIALQFFGETQLLTLFAMIAGVCLAELILPFFNSIADKSLSINYFSDAHFLFILLGITFVTGLIAGSYPALMLSRFEPIKVLKGLQSFQFKPKLTKALLVVQYSLSIFLIISSLIMFKQLDFVSSKDLGYNEEQVLFVPTHTGWNEEGTKLMERYRQELSGMPGVKTVSGMTPAFTKGSNVYGFKDQDGEDRRVYVYYVDEELIPAMGMELVSGRNFRSDRPADETESIIVNEALVKERGWDLPVGKTMIWRGGENPSSIIGVVKDFHFLSMEAEIQPMVFHMDPEQGGITEIAVKIEEGKIAQTIPRLEAAWKEIAPFTPFNYWFLDEAVAQQYEQYSRWLNIMGVATFIAILIACLGLFGLAGLTAVNKTKEIGIRKVLGAGISQIILLLNKDVIKLIAISISIAAPVSWYVMEKWLSDFAYRIEIGSGLFIASGIITLLIALITVSYYSVKAALINPVDSLRSE